MTRRWTAFYATASRRRSPATPTSGDGDGRPDAGTIDLARIERAVREILTAVGEDPDREGLLETPDRVARMYAEVFAGLHTDPAVTCRRRSPRSTTRWCWSRTSSSAVCCEHHLLPFTGTAHIAYLPDGQVVGLSKLARVVDVVARRPQVQERMTEDLADLVMRELQPRGVGVVIEASTRA